MEGHDTFVCCSILSTTNLENNTLMNRNKLAVKGYKILMYNYIGIFNLIYRMFHEVLPPVTEYVPDVIWKHFP